MIRENNFVFLRFVVAICVLMGHISTHMGIHAFGYTEEKAFYHIGIPFFFVLSAFLIYPSYTKKREKGETVLSFFIKRFLRLAPSVYFITVVSVIIFLCVGALTIDVFTEQTFWAWIASNLLLLPVYNPSIFSHIGVGVINGSLWTILTFVAFYALVPVFYSFEKKYSFKKLITILLTLSIIFLGIELWRNSLSSENLFSKIYKVSPLPHLLFFSIGMFWSRFWPLVPKKTWMFVSCVIIALIFKEDILGITPYIGPLNDVLWAIPYSYAIIWFGYHGFKVFRVFNKFEDLGMGIFIWHMVVINLFLYWKLHQISWLANEFMYFLVIIITVILAYISRVFIEKPVLKIQFNKKSTNKIIA